MPTATPEVKAINVPNVGAAPAMTNYFANQVAIVTGASSGIGWELAKALALNGARVGLVARRKDKLDELTGQIRATGGVAAAASADVGNQAEVESAVRAIAAELG